jgi:hypothetical protein
MIAWGLEDFRYRRLANLHGQMIRNGIVVEGER